MVLDTNIVVKAKKFAGQRHKGQMYGGENITMMYHLDMVANRALEWGAKHPHVLAVCYLHDVLEDTETTFEELQAEFGTTIATLVSNLTDAEGKNRSERWLKTAYRVRSHRQSLFVKLCDRYENMSQSLKTKHDHLGMYVKEYPIFKASLYDSDWQEQWECLDTLYNQMVDSINGK